MSPRRARRYHERASGRRGGRERATGKFLRSRRGAAGDASHCVAAPIIGELRSKGAAASQKPDQMPFFLLFF